MNKVFDIMEVPEEWRNKLSEYIAENFSIKVIDCIADPYDKMENGDYHSSILIDLDRFAKMIVQECANYIRTNLDSWDAEPLAFCMERDFGLHGDYAE